MALTNAERQARYRERRQAGEARLRYRRPADRRSRPQQWGDAVRTLLALQDQYREWRDALPASLAGSATAALLEQVCDLDLSELEASSCPGASGVTARPPATASGWRPAKRGLGCRHPEAVDACGARRLAGRSGTRSCGTAGVSTCCARPPLRYGPPGDTRPPRGSDGSYGPCGPAWTERPGRPRRSRDAVDRRIRGTPDRNRRPGLQPVVDLHTPFVRGSVFGVARAELDRSTYGSARDVLR